MLTELSIVAKVTIVLAMALMAAWALRGARASMRALLLSSAFGVLLALPAASLLIPERLVEIPVAYEETFPLFFDQVQPAPAMPTMTTADESQVASAWRLPSIVSLVRGAWALMLAGLLARLGIALWRLRGIRRTAVPWMEGQAMADALARDAGIGRRIDIVVHESVAAPMTFGVRQPVIALPIDAERWHAQPLRHALIHELEHVRRGDWPIHLMAQAVCALYWVHPLAWVAARRMCLEAERACDDAVLHDAEGAAYAEQLVTLARRLVKRDPVAVLSMAARSDLSTRVRAVLDANQARGRAGVVFALLVVSCAAVCTLLLSPLQAVSVSAARTAAAPLQAPATTSAFDVASIKRNNGPTPGQTIRLAGNTLLATNVTLRDLIRTAYSIQTPEQLSGGPDWIASARYDVEAKSAGEVPWTEHLAMLQTLLANRIRLVLRREGRPTPIYALTRGSAVRLKPAAACPTTADCSGFNTRPGEILGRHVTMARMAGILSGQRSGRRVVDSTGLDGLFDVELRWAPDPGPPPPGAAPDDAPTFDETRPSLFTALEEQLGLRLVPTTGNVDHFIIERAERPSEN
jgi:uncharacterized protein (TIGR03435 family)